MDKIITKLYKYHIFDITIAIVFLIISGIITVPPTFSEYFDNSITSQKLAGFLEKDDVILSNINAERNKLKEKVKIESIDLSYNNLPGIDLIFNSTLADSHLENFQFSGNLSNTNINNSYFTVADLNKKVNLTKANLATANLYGTNLTDADLTGADLTDADLTHAVLINANLTFTDLKEAILIGADLTNATLKDADLTNTILLDANLTNADLNHVKFNGTFFNCESLKTTTSITDLIIQNIILLDSNFNKITSC
jgi:uncharacterized protein YjbI with pentapeptide repeats